MYDTQSGRLLNRLDGMDDATNGVSFTRLSNQKSYLAVATGSRRFAEEYESDEDDRPTGIVQTPGHMRLYKLGVDKKDASTKTQEEEVP